LLTTKPVNGSTFVGKLDGPYTTGVDVNIGVADAVTVGVRVGVAVFVGSGLGVMVARTGISDELGTTFVGALFRLHPASKKTRAIPMMIVLRIQSSDETINPQSYRVSRYLPIL
jgi:hypothetical protein